MGRTAVSQGNALAEIRARTALREAGLDPCAPLVRASSVTNEVWLSPTHAVRVNRRPSNRLFRESLIAQQLPAGVGYPTVVAHGGGRGEDWLVLERAPGEPLAHVWPDLTVGDREGAISQVAERLAILHRTPAPPGLPPMDHAPQLLSAGAADPTRPLVDALAQALSLAYVDQVMLTMAVEMVQSLAPALEPFQSTTLVHGDVTFENILWHDGEVTALLDLEWSRPGPSDLDLDILLRCAAYPHLHVAEDHAERTRSEDYLDVPWWLRAAYPELFEYPRQIDRVRIYSMAYDARDLLVSPPQVPVHKLPALHAYHRLQRVVERRSYLDLLTQPRG